MSLSLAADAPYVKVQGKNLVTDFDQDGKYEPFFIKGVDYEPMPITRHVSDWGWPLGYPANNNIYDDDAILTRDFTNLRNLGANTIRIWNANDISQPDGRYPNRMTSKTLDYARNNNIKVIAGFGMGQAGELICSGSTKVYNTFINYKDANVRNAIINKFKAFITTFKNRPEILFWVIGNENNYNLNKLDLVQIKAYYSLANQMAAEAKAIEGVNYHPVAIVDGDIEFIGRQDYGTRDEDLPFIDLWGVNSYRGMTFGNLFNDFSALSQKPLYVSEFGADAFHSNDALNPAAGAENQNEQAQWDGLLWDEIVANGGKTIGGTVMEYADEWWKPYEWNCEDNDCRTQINSNDVVFYWALRPQASNYHVKIGTTFGSGNIFNGYADPTKDHVHPTNVVTGVTIYVEFSYVAAGRTITEYSQYLSYTPVVTTQIAIKLKQYSSIHNTQFGVGPKDTSCPRDGVLDNFPKQPDGFSNEEYWGLMSIARNGYSPDTLTPRLAYNVLQQKYVTAAPFIALGTPTGQLPSGTTELSVATDIDAVCKYDTIPNQTYTAMRNTFTATGGKHHTKTLNGLPAGTYTYYVRCQSTAGYANSKDYPISFSLSGGYAAWKALKFTPAQQADDAVSGINADPDHDGQANLLEYAFNLDPWKSDTASYQAFILNNHYVFKFRQNVNATDVTILIGARSDFSSPWDYSTFVYADPQMIDATTQLMTATEESIDTSVVTRRFYKVEVSLQGQAPIAFSPMASHAYFTLEVSKSGSGNVTSLSGHINCGEECFFDGIQGTKETLTAIPDTGYKFDGWSGDCTGTGNCIVTYNDIKTVVANFSLLPRCGDAHLDTGEECDGETFGARTCQSQGFSGGTLGCDANCNVVTSACVNYRCTGKMPANASVCAGDNSGLKANTPYRVVNECTKGTKCETTCHAPYVLKDGLCSTCGNGTCSASEGETCSTCPYDCGPCVACSGTPALNSVVCSGDEAGLITSLPYRLTAECTKRKCETVCKTGYVKSVDTCVAQAVFTTPARHDAPLKQKHRWWLS
jgi:hypothetical protein